MSTVEEIKSAIEQLTLEQRAELARWMNGWEDDEWDQQMKADIKAGKLDAMIARAKAAAASGKFDQLFAEVDDDMKAGGVRDLPLIGG